MSHHLKPFEPFGDLMSFDPVRDVEAMLRELRHPGQWRQDALAIRLDVEETEQEYAVRADIPGVDKDAIKVEIDGNRVVISAERTQDTEKKRGNTVRSERHWGTQYRAFTLPSPVDETKAEARYEHGVLKLTLPKKPGAGMHRLDIH